MTNSEVYDRLEQAHDVKINKLFWLAGSLECQDLKDMLEDEMSDRDWAEVFPDIPLEEHQDYIESNQASSIFIMYAKLGFLVQLYIPNHYNFTYDKNGIFLGCSISSGINSIDYAYGETLEKLVDEIERVAEVQYEIDKVKDKEKKRSKPNK